jgi:hypothetical protein
MILTISPICKGVERVIRATESVWARVLGQDVRMAGPRLVTASEPCLPLQAETGQGVWDFGGFAGYRGYKGTFVHHAILFPLQFLQILEHFEYVICPCTIYLTCIHDVAVRLNLIKPPKRCARPQHKHSKGWKTCSKHFKALAAPCDC